MGIPRALHPVTNPTGYVTAIGFIYAAATMLYNAHYHHGVISTPVIIAAIGGFGTLFTRHLVTPVSDPKDGAGRTLIPVPPALPPLPRPVPVARTYGGDVGPPPPDARITNTGPAGSGPSLGSSSPAPATGAVRLVPDPPPGPAAPGPGAAS